MRDETLLPGTIFAGRFRIEGELGRGGMGVVYAATDVVTEREVALKVIAKRHARVPEFVERFKRECKAVAALSHENIVRLYEANTTSQGDWYLVMERLVGVSLRELLRTAPHGRLSVPHATHIALQLVDALAVAHAKGIWHRDIKPENGFVGEKSRFWLLDFGLAKRASAGTQTDEQRPMGTYRYLPPELVHGRIRPDGRADFYQVGIVYFEMLTGRSPYPVLDEADATATDIQAAHAFMEPTLLREVLPDAPPRAEAVISRCLRKAREDRYQTAKVLGDDLFAVILDVLSPDHPIAVRMARHRAGSSDLWPKVTVPAKRPAPEPRAPAPEPVPPAAPPRRASPRSLVPTLRGLPGPTRADASLDATAVAVAPIVAVDTSGPPVVVREEAPAPSHAVTAPLDPAVTPPDASPPWLQRPRVPRSSATSTTRDDGSGEYTANGTERLRPSTPAPAASRTPRAEGVEPRGEHEEARPHPAEPVASPRPEPSSTSAELGSGEDDPRSPVPEEAAGRRFVRVRFVRAASGSAAPRGRASDARAPFYVATANGWWKPRRSAPERMAWFAVKALAGPDAEPVFPDLPPEAATIARTPTPQPRRKKPLVMRLQERKPPKTALPRSLAPPRVPRVTPGRMPLALAVMAGLVMALAGVAFAVRLRAPSAGHAPVPSIPSGLAQDRPRMDVPPPTGGDTRPASDTAAEAPAESGVPMRAAPAKPPRPPSTASAATPRPPTTPEPKALF